MTMMNLADIRKQIAATTEALAKADTELKWELAASAADVAGMVDPTPVSDLIGAGLAVRKGDWFGAGMSVASMVPYVGDALAKPAKAVRAAKKINALRETLAKMTAKLADLKKAEKQAEAAEAAAKEAKIAKEAAEGAGSSSGKKAAGEQKDTANGQKDADCEDCSPANHPGSNAPRGNRNNANLSQPPAGSAPNTQGKKLLPSEGDVGTYDELAAAGSKGDHITPHHIPSANHMAQHGVKRGDGISINMEQPHPGTGGRHRRTFTYGSKADLDMHPRDALAKGVQDARQIYQRDGLYTPEIRSSLQELIEKNKTTYPKIFEKPRK
jgi:hypothetical protein